MHAPLSSHRLGRKGPTPIRLRPKTCGRGNPKFPLFARLHLFDHATFLSVGTVNRPRVLLCSLLLIGDPQVGCQPGFRPSHVGKRGARDASYLPLVNRSTLSKRCVREGPYALYVPYVPVGSSPLGRSVCPASYVLHDPHVPPCLSNRVGRNALLRPDYTWLVYFVRGRACVYLQMRFGCSSPCD